MSKLVLTEGYKFNLAKKYGINDYPCPSWVAY